MLLTSANAQDDCLLENNSDQTDRDVDGIADVCDPVFNADNAISSVLIGIAMSHGVEACPDEIENALNKLNAAALQAGETPPDNKSAIENVENAIEDLDAVVAKGCDLDGDISNIIVDLAAMARAIAEQRDGVSE